MQQIAYSSNIQFLYNRIIYISYFIPLGDRFIKIAQTIIQYRIETVCIGLY